MSSNQLTAQFENNRIELSHWDINDKVSFNLDSLGLTKKKLGVVVGFSYNIRDELLVNVREFTESTEGEIRQLHPSNRLVDLKNLSKYKPSSNME